MTCSCVRRKPSCRDEISGKILSIASLRIQSFDMTSTLAFSHAAWDTKSCEKRVFPIPGIPTGMIIATVRLSSIFFTNFGLLWIKTRGGHRLSQTVRLVTVVCGAVEEALEISGRYALGKAQVQSLGYGHPYAVA
jgi:hypothetical protein